MDLFFKEGQVKKNKTWVGESRVDTTLVSNIDALGSHLGKLLYGTFQNGP